MCSGFSALLLGFDLIAITSGKTGAQPKINWNGVNLVETFLLVRYSNRTDLMWTSQSSWFSFTNFTRAVVSVWLIRHPSRSFVGDMQKRFSSLFHTKETVLHRLSSQILTPGRCNVCHLKLAFPSAKYVNPCSQTRHCSLNSDFGPKYPSVE